MASRIFFDVSFYDSPQKIKKKRTHRPPCLHHFYLAVKWLTLAVPGGGNEAALASPFCLWISNT